MIKVVSDSKQATLVIKNIGVKLSNLRPVFNDFQTYMQSRTTLMFSKLKRGGTYRGVTWPWFAKQYTRADGTVVPAEGGIPKVRGSGVVLGRKRHSGTRVSSKSSLLQDSGNLKTSALSMQKLRGDTFIMDTPAEYGKFLQKIRPWQFFEIPKDINYLEQRMNKYLAGVN